MPALAGYYVVHLMFPLQVLGLYTLMVPASGTITVSMIAELNGVGSTLQMVVALMDEAAAGMGEDTMMQPLLISLSLQRAHRVRMRRPLT